MGILLFFIHEIHITKWYIMIIVFIWGEIIVFFLCMSINGRLERNSVESVIAKLLVNVFFKFAIL